MNKYHAKRTEVDGHTFDSAKEARRYSELKLLERAGEIVGLRLQPKFPLVVNDTKIADYKGDFEYRDASGRRILEDTKGFKTPVYRLKKKLVRALYGIEILET